MDTTRNILFLFLLMFISTEIYSQYPNFRLFASNAHQMEPFIVRHPTNQQILFASAYTLRPPSLRGEGIYVSTNGGNTWSGVDSCNGGAYYTHGGDPVPVIDKNGIFILTHQGGFQTGMFSNYSTDQGVTWSSPTYTILADDDVDKGFSATDDAPASPFYGRTYIVWTRFVPPVPIVISHTTNGAVSWSSYIQINSSCGGRRSFGPSLVVSPTGTVYVAWAAASVNSPFPEDFIGFAKSSNGGINWTVNECAIDCNGIRTTQLLPWQIRANSFPVIDVDKTGGPRHGWIYIAVTNKNLAPAGSDPDIVLHRSTDNGNSWSAGVRVNQDQINNGRSQFFPALRVDEDGGVNIIYYDSRNAADSVDVYLSRSTNGGVNWNDYRVTSQRFRPAPLSGLGQGNMGDNIGLTSGNDNLYPIWMSNITGILQIWAAIINYTTIGIKQISGEIPISYALLQNYPNPFNPVTKIKFDLPQGERNRRVQIIVYDITGKEIRELVNQDLNPGIYEVDFDGSDLPSGVYYYRLEAGSYSETRKMVLVK